MSVLSAGESAGTQAGRRVTARRPRLSQSKREWVAAYLFLLADVLGLVLFVGIPMVLSLSLGFFNVSGYGTYTFSGLANYRKMFADPLFLGSLQVTAKYVLVLVPGLYVTGLGLALLVKRPIPLVGLFRAMLFLPNVISLVVVALIWKFLLVDRIGVANVLLSKFGLGGRSWLGDPDLTLWALLGVTIWFLMGFYMLIFLAGLQEIPREYYDAARIDGAGSWRSFWDITLPLLKPTSFFVLLVSLVAAVAGPQGFDLVYVMTSGGPANSTNLTTYYIFDQAFRYSNFGYAAAMASFLVLVLLVLTGILFALTRGGRFDFD
ncbi:MAG: carbohydrate ABC transporter permease [Thermomicrobiales bacterium]